MPSVVTVLVPSAVIYYIVQLLSHDYLTKCSTLEEEDEKKNETIEFIFDSIIRDGGIVCVSFQIVFPAITLTYGRNKRNSHT